MIPNIHQSIDEIIRAASPAEKVMWQQIILLCGERAAVKQHFFQGTVAGSEFVNYSANKLYFALSLTLGNASGAAAGYIVATLHNESNAACMYINNNSIYWDATAAAPKYYHNTINVDNAYFSRIATAYSTLKFIGYRINY